MRYIIIFLPLLIFAKEIVVDNLQGTGRFNLSNSDVNRLVFKYDIKYKIVSKEKDLIVTAINNELYIKFNPILKEEQKTLKEKIVTGKKKIIYPKKPAEIFVVTEKKTYSLILYPKKQETTTIYFTETLLDKKETIQKLRKKENIYTKEIADIVRNILKHSFLKGYDSKKVKDIYKKVSVTSIRANLLIKKVAVYKGYKYTIEEYNIYNPTKFAFEIPDFKDILRAINTKNILAYSIYYLNQTYKLYPKKSMKLLIIRITNE